MKKIVNHIPISTKITLSLFLLLIMVFPVVISETISENSITINIRNYDIKIQVNNEQKFVNIEVLRDNATVTKKTLSSLNTDSIIIYNNTLVSYDPFILNHILKSVSYIYLNHKCNDSPIVDLTLKLSDSETYYIVYITCNQDSYKAMITPYEMIVSETTYYEASMVLGAILGIMETGFIESKNTSTMNTLSLITKETGNLIPTYAVGETGIKGQNIASSIENKEEVNYERVILSVLLPLGAGLAIYILLRKFLL